ncbi:polycystin-2 [Trichonephila clavata]|uniref:Polycystin-2 n=1 Tax=Trichonephila clavata TaxID=2740835 RepID=A0A8X6F493_TRICU|nr:polycystin-2 [Trichonephila clavata]
MSFVFRSDSSKCGFHIMSPFKICYFDFASQSYLRSPRPFNLTSQTAGMRSILVIAITFLLVMDVFSQQLEAMLAGKALHILARAAVKAKDKKKGSYGVGAVVKKGKSVAEGAIGKPLKVVGILLGPLGFNMARRDTTKRRRPSVADDEIGEAWGGVTKDNEDEGIMVDDLYIQADETDIVPEKERTGCWHGCMRSIKGVWATRQMAGNAEADREWYVKTTIKELVIYLVFLTILCILTFGMMSPNMYYLTKVISELFLESPYEDTRNNVKGSTQIIDFWRVRFSILFSSFSFNL